MFSAPPQTSSQTRGENIEDSAAGLSHCAWFTIVSYIHEVATYWHRGTVFISNTRISVLASCLGILILYRGMDLHFTGRLAIRRKTSHFSSDEFSFSAITEVLHCIAQPLVWRLLIRASSTPPSYNARVLSSALQSVVSSTTPQELSTGENIVR